MLVYENATYIVRVAEEPLALHEAKMEVAKHQLGMPANLGFKKCFISGTIQNTGDRTLSRGWPKLWAVNIGQEVLFQQTLAPPLGISSIAPGEKARFRYELPGVYWPSIRIWKTTGSPKEFTKLK